MSKVVYLFFVSLTAHFFRVVKSSVESAGMAVIICTCAIKATEEKTFCDANKMEV